MSFVALILASPSSVAAGTHDAHLSQPNVPHEVVSGRPFTVTGFGDTAATSGPVKLLFYQDIRGSWVLMRTVRARWSGWTATTSKYLSDVSLPYAGTWRIGASYGGNATYSCDYAFRDITVLPKALLHLPQPNVPSSITPGKVFTITSGYVDQKAATGPVRLLFYQLISGKWVLQKQLNASWSGGWPYDPIPTVQYRGENCSLPYVGIWRIGAAYPGNSIYASEYAYRDFQVASPYLASVVCVPTATSYTPQQNGQVVISIGVHDQAGLGVEGAKVSTVWHFKTGNRYVTTVTDAKGNAAVSMNIGDAAIGYQVDVDVTAAYAGRTARSSTSFVPQ